MTSRMLLTARFLGALGLVFALALPTQAETGKTYEIDQIMDMTALTPEDFYRFVPNYLWVDPGDTIRFVNTTVNHTVKSVDGIWPNGVQHVDISNQSATEIELKSPGVYGFRCKVHSRHGMFALVIVGSPEPNLDQISLNNLNDRGKLVFGKLLEQMAAEANKRKE